MTTTRGYVCLSLKKNGYEVSEAADGRAALESLERNKPDLIVADVMMPLMGGFEFLKAVRDDERSKEIPVILLSALANEKSKIEGLEAGADEYLVKPFPTNELLARIQVNLKMARIRGEAAAREHQLRLKAECAAEKWREAEERLRLLIESAVDYAIFVVSENGLITFWNTGAERIFGYGETEIIGQSGEILFTPEDRADQIPEKEMRQARETGRGEDDRWHIRKDGSLFLASGVMMPQGETGGFVKIARDRTEKILREKAERDREVLQKMLGAQEDERKRIALDLHDQLGQQLTALRLKIEILKGMCDDEELCEQIEKTQEIARQIDDDVDYLAWNMRPSALEDIGLAAALDKFVREWSVHFNIAADFQTSGFGKKRLAPEAETHFYRIVQEALNNVSKHSRASFVDISLERRNGFAVMIVEDDGNGFEPDERMTGGIGAKAMGLLGMRERAALVGGSIEIESAPGIGTTIFVRVPVSKAEGRKKS